MDGDDKWSINLTGDGELQEEPNLGSLTFATAKIVDNLMVTVDWNDAQIGEQLTPRSSANLGD